MRTAILAILALPLLAGTPPKRVRPEPGQVSRIENKSSAAWQLGMGQRVAGEIQVRPAGSHDAPASLQKEGDTFTLVPGQAFDMKVLPTKQNLALQVTFSTVGGSAGASIFISQGNPGDPHTLNINESKAVHVDKARYGHNRAGAFVTID
jgi:hypothetical protein